MASLIAGASMIADSATAQDRIELSGNTRVRYETIDGQARTGFDPSDDLVNIRTILTAAYEKGPFRLGAEIYDSRVYAADPGTPVTTNEVNAVELVQVWAAVDVNAPFGKGSKATIQAGRFLLNIGSRRLVAADDYRNTTNSYTGARVDLSLPGSVAATLIYTLPQVRLPDDRASLIDNHVAFDRESFDLVLWGGTGIKKGAIGATAVELSYYHLDERDAPGRPTRNRSLDTFGARMIREPKPGRFDHEVEAIYQTGSIRAGLAPNAARLDVAAWFAHADAGYTFAMSWTPRLSVEFDYASGDKGAGRYNRFDTLFGMRRADLAPAGLYNAIARTNILTPGIRVEAVPSKRLDLFVNYRLLWLASATDAFSSTGVRAADGSAGRFAGQQIEGRVRWWLSPERLRLEVDGLLLLKGRFLETAPNAPRNGNTRYLSLNATASF